MLDHLHIRNRFLQYFQQQEHTLVAPSNIIPADDPTLLFTNAGMNQFKDVLLGREKRSYTRAISIQPCMRVGGKHNDLDEVGRDGRHLTWFEMLGNWSFGDYGKEEAIVFAWEMVTKHLNLDTSKLYASVYRNDDEAHALWKKISTLPDSNIVRLGNIEEGDEENFWSMGPTGPCGRCTELYYDQGEALFGHDVVGGSTDRFLEFWNLVFMEFDRNEQGEFKPLPMLSVDTGMGMERITAILEGKTSVFETGLFLPLIERAAHLSGRDPRGEDLVSMRVLADHSRGLTFTLNDGGTFDRQGRGYVLRRILRRAVLHGHKLGFREPFLHKLVETNLKTLPVYGVSDSNRKRIEDAIQQEEERFFATLDRGLGFFDNAIQQGSISGEAAFQLHDTFGFPIDLTRILAEEKGISVDGSGFEKALEEQRQRSAQHAHFYDKGGWVTLKTGESHAMEHYGQESLETAVLQYRDNGDGTMDMLLEKTPFYAEGGGEMADHGTLQQGDLRLSVQNVAKTPTGIIHTARLEQGKILALHASNIVQAKVSTLRRNSKAAHHTATHLLHAALRKVLGNSVRQTGSLVDEHRLRFDISFDRALHAEELHKVENLVNQWILEAHPTVHLEKVPMTRAQEMGALAFFGDKYGDTVRVIHIEGVSTELCGGNHVHNTGQIGAFLLVSDEALGAGVRRLEAICHLAAVKQAREDRQQLGTLARELAVPVTQIGTRVQKLQEELKAARTAYQKALRQGGSSNSAESLLTKMETLGGKKVLIADVTDTPEELLPEWMDTLRQQTSDGIFFLLKMNPEEGKALLLAGAGDNAVSAGAHAGNLAKAVGQAMGGGGGGKPTFARTGFRAENVDVVIKAIHTLFNA